MQNSKQIFRQTSTVFEKPGTLPEKLKTQASSNNRELNTCCRHFQHVFHLPKSTKRCAGFIYCLDLELFVSIKKRTGFYTLTETRFFTFLLIAQDLNKIIKKIPNIISQTILKTCAKLQLKMLNSIVVRARQGFQFFSQVICFLGNNRALSKFKFGLCII